jgi:Ca2+-binding RTX toxin-like protein
MPCHQQHRPLVRMCSCLCSSLSNIQNGLSCSLACKTFEVICPLDWTTFANSLKVIVTFCSYLVLSRFLICLSTPPVITMVTDATTITASDLLQASATILFPSIIILASPGISVSEYFSAIFQYAYGDTIRGTSQTDSLTGTTENDRIFGGGENDILVGLEGEDIMDGGRGNDTSSGSTGDDYLFGGGDDDIIRGEEGNDEVEGENGDDQITGGQGDDTLVGGMGDDPIEGDDGNDNLFGGPGNDTLSGGPGLDYFDCGLNGGKIIDFNITDGDARSSNCDD